MKKSELKQLIKEALREELRSTRLTEKFGDFDYSELPDKVYDINDPRLDGFFKDYEALVKKLRMSFPKYDFQEQGNWPTNPKAICALSVMTPSIDGQPGKVDRLYLLDIEHNGRTTFDDMVKMIKDSGIEDKYGVKVSSSLGYNGIEGYFNFDLR